MKLVPGISKALAPCIALVVLAACSQSQLTPGGSPGGTVANSRAHRADTTINTNIILYNAYATYIDLDTVTPNACPWTLGTSAPSEIPPDGHTNPITLTYDESCTPSSNVPVWSISYGTDISHSATVCAFHVTYHSASGGYFTYSVTNGTDTSCSIYESSSGWVFEYQYSGSLHKHSRKDASLRRILSS
jgi:hypothetical protein